MEINGKGLSEPLLLRPAEAARLLSISRSKAYELIARGEMPGIVRLGRSVRVSLAALRDWIERQAAERTGAADHSQHLTTSARGSA